MEQFQTRTVTVFLHQFEENVEIRYLTLFTKWQSDTIEYYRARTDQKDSREMLKCVT